MLRAAFLYLSTARWAHRLVTGFFLARRAARRFVAGETLDEAITVARTLNQKGLMVSLDHLGESVRSEEAARRAAADYLECLDGIYRNSIDGNISVKLTQLGLDIDESLCIDNMRRILTKASEIDTTVTIDMESSVYTETTLRVFRLLARDFNNVGTVIQSYLRRSEADMKALAQEGAMIRLCKGAYKEPPDIAFPDKADVDKNYITIMRQFMSEANRKAGAYLKIATHDPKIIETAIAYIKENQIPGDQFEFQMLYGIRPQTQLDLRQRGYRVRVYVPYGTEWYPYFMRRLAERPANAWFILKNLFSR
jgi:proline dehydrogenase